MDKYKNSIAVQGSHNHLMAFIKDLQDIGYTEYVGPGDHLDFVVTYRDGRYCKRNHDCGYDILTLPNEWEKAIKLASEVKVEEPFKVSDWVKCKPGFSNTGHYDGPNYGGAGYLEGRVFKIDAINFLSHGDLAVATSKEFSHGVFLKALEKPTKEEIESHLISEAEKKGFVKGAKVNVREGLGCIPGTHTISSLEVDDITGTIIRVKFVSGYASHLDYIELLPSTPQIKIGGKEVVFGVETVAILGKEVFGSNFIDTHKALTPLIKHGIKIQGIQVKTCDGAEFLVSVDHIKTIAEHFQGGKP